MGPEAFYAALTPDERAALLYTWRAMARPSQIAPPGDWLTWLVLAGRGFGKSRTGAEWLREQVDAGLTARAALVGRTAADVRDVMVEGDSGILAVFPPGQRPRYEPSKRRLTFHTGAIATTYTADEPDLLRGPQHDTAWVDEVATFRYPETWDNLQLGLRMGPRPRQVVTTTPRPVRIMRDLLKAPTTVVTRGTSYENRANLAPAFFAQIVARYEGTRLARQEILGQLLDDVPGALWRRDMIQRAILPLPDMRRVVVAIDPAVTSGEEADETGIIVAGKTVTGSYCVLADHSGRFTPDGWARRAIHAFQEFRADRIIGEVNNGGEMVEFTLRTVSPQVPYRAVHATRGKLIRAEPIAALYEQGRVFHVGDFPDLEDQLCNWTQDSGESPDRLDALVWAMSELSTGGSGGSIQGSAKDSAWRGEKGSIFRDRAR